MGRKPKVTVTTEVVDNMTIQPIANSQQVVLLKETKTFSFKNLLPGMIFFTRETGKEDFFEGHEIKDDITTKERQSFLNSETFKKGYLVEETEEFTDSGSKNSLSDAQIDDLIKKNKGNIKFLEDWVQEMDSDFAVVRLKEAFLRHDLPASLMGLCEYKLQKLEEIYLKSQEAPVDSMKE